MARHSWAIVQRRQWPERPEVVRCRGCLMEKRTANFMGNTKNRHFRIFKAWIRPGFAQRWVKLEGRIGPCPQTQKEVT